MSRPSEPLLRWIRSQMEARDTSIAALAARLDRPRAELRRRIAGTEALTVDDLLAITEALGIEPTDLGVPDVPELPDDVDASDGAPVGMSNQPRVLLATGFDHGIDLVFLADTAALDGWGGPDDVVEAYRDKELPIRLDAAFHADMKPELDDEGLSITLSFDRLYRCHFPWTSVVRVIFLPDPPEPVEAEPPPTDAPFLRLVE